MKKPKPLEFEEPEYDIIGEGDEKVVGWMLAIIAVVAIIAGLFALAAHYHRLDAQEQACYEQGKVWLEDIGCVPIRSDA